MKGVCATCSKLKLPRLLRALPKAMVGTAIAAVSPTAVMAANVLLCMWVLSCLSSDHRTDYDFEDPRRGRRELRGEPDAQVGAEAPAGSPAPNSVYRISAVSADYQNR